MKKSTLTVLALAGLISASSAFADDHGFYVLGGVGKVTGGDGGQSSIDNALGTAGGGGFSSSMDNPTVYRLQGGYQLNQNWAVEGGYLGSSNTNYSASGGNLPGTVTSSGSLSGWNVTGVGILPLANKFSLVGKLGVANMQESADVSAGNFSTSTGGSKTDATYGVGLKYDFNNATFIRADLDSYNIGNSNGSSRSTIGTINVGYKF